MRAFLFEIQDVREKKKPLWISAGSTFADQLRKVIRMLFIVLRRLNLIIPTELSEFVALNLFKKKTTARIFEVKTILLSDPLCGKLS